MPKDPATISQLFTRFLLGAGSGAIGTIVLGIILLFSWFLIGDILLPTADSTINEVGETIDYTQKPHPLFLSVVILAVFLATLVANLFHCTITSSTEADHQNRATNLTQVFIGNLTIFFVFILIYIISSRHGTPGIAITALAHTMLASLFTLLALDMLNPHRYLLLSLYAGIVGSAMFLCFLQILGLSNPALIAFTCLPLLLGSLNASRSLVAMFYQWFKQTYNNDVLDAEKRFGTDYGRTPDTTDELLEEL